MNKQGQRWILDDLYLLQNLIVEGYTIEEISEKLERSEKACATKAYDFVLRKTSNEKKVVIEEFLKA